MAESLGADALAGIVAGYKLMAALRAAVELGIPDALAEQPLTARELSTRIDVPGVGLDRVLRLLVSQGALVLAGDRYANSGLTESLMSGPARDMFLGWQALPPFVAAWQHLADAVRTDRSPFLLTHGQDLHDYFESHPDDRALYDAANASTADGFNALAEAMDLSAVSTLVSVGGASGTELVPVLRRWPRVRAILADLPTALAAAPKVLAENGLSDRVTITATDARTCAPAGDAYLLSTVLRCLSDDDAIAVLRACHEAADPNATMHVIEMPIPDGPPQHPNATADVTAWVAYGGADRTVRTWIAMHADAGWHDLQVAPLDGPFVLLSSRR